MQQWTGLSLTGYATTFLKNAGWSVTAAFNINMVITAMNLVGCGLEFLVINRFGRRPILLWGMVALTACCIIIGGLGCVPINHAKDHIMTGKEKGALKGLAAFLIMLNLIFHMSVGPVGE